jgi:hypothetical protein
VDAKGLAVVVIVLGLPVALEVLTVLWSRRDRARGADGSRG